MEQKRKQQLLKIVRGNNFRRALKAIAELRASSDAATVSAVAEAAAADTQNSVSCRSAREAQTWAADSSDVGTSQIAPITKRL